LDSQPDPKPLPRIRDAKLLRDLHLEWKECALCHNTQGLSLHHISKHPRDDARGNLVMLCGSGTTGCHGKIEAGDHALRRQLGVYLVLERPDVLEYLEERLGGYSPRDAWLMHHLLLEGI
jgi:hypothetical protein